jgi:hypothetical protein
MLRWASGALLWTRNRTFVFQKLCANSWLADSRSVLKDHVPQPDLTLTVQKVAGSNYKYLLDYSLYQWDEINVHGKEWLQGSETAVTKPVT